MGGGAVPGLLKLALYKRIRQSEAAPKSAVERIQNSLDTT